MRYRDQETDELIRKMRIELREEIVHKKRVEKNIDKKLELR